MGWIDRGEGLAIARQCELAGVARATFYGRQTPREEFEEDLVLCGLIDEEYTRRPFYGSRRMVVLTPVVKSGRHEVQPHAADC